MSYVVQEANLSCSAGKNSKVFVVQVPVRGSLILRWIKKQLQWKESENLE